MVSFNDFIDYVWSFYNTEDGIYPIEGITKDQVIEASWLYLQMCNYPSFPTFNWGDGDTLDREHVRDIIIEKYNLSYRDNDNYASKVDRLVDNMVSSK